MIRDPDPLHRRSIRLRDLDYAQHGAYFVTICVHHRQCLLSEIVNGEVRLSGAGQIVNQTWKDLPSRFPNVGSDAFVIMPNHVHAIIVIYDFEIGPPGETVGAGLALPEKEGNPRVAPTLGNIVGAFKSISAIACNRLLDRRGLPFWQRNYYEHVIRHDREWDALRDYIVCNPGRWADDPDHPANIREHP
jgi:putative transposase